MTTTTTTKKYYADSNGKYDIESVMRDAQDGVKLIEIDFSACAPTLNKQLSKQEDYYLSIDCKAGGEGHKNCVLHSCHCKCHRGQNK